MRGRNPFASSSTWNGRECETLHRRRRIRQPRSFHFRVGDSPSGARAVEAGLEGEGARDRGGWIPAEAIWIRRGWKDGEAAKRERKTLERDSIEGERGPWNR